MSHLTFLFLHVVHDLEFNPAVPFAPAVGGVALFPLTAAGSLGERMLFGLELDFWRVEEELVSRGDKEKS